MYFAHKARTSFLFTLFCLNVSLKIARITSHVADCICRTIHAMQPSKMRVKPHPPDTRAASLKAEREIVRRRPADAASKRVSTSVRPLGAAL